MSQNWDGHWIEENYKPTRLRNWEVPNWHPKWLDKHCKISEFQVDDQGHLLAQLKKKKKNHSCNELNFKSTWELPKKISRRLAEELSGPPIYKEQMWKVHKAYHRVACGRIRFPKSVEREPEQNRENMMNREEDDGGIRETVEKDSMKSMITTATHSQSRNILGSEINPNQFASKYNNNKEDSSSQMRNDACLLYQTCKL